MHVALHKLEFRTEHVTRQRHLIKAILIFDKQNIREQCNTIQCTQIQNKTLENTAIQYNAQKYKTKQKRRTVVNEFES